MNSLIILYPELFNCYSKFERHVKKYTSNPNVPKIFEIFFKHDCNSFIEKVCSDAPNLNFGKKLKSMDLAYSKYAIIFDDGECFNDEIKLLKERGVKCRVIKIPITRVININTDPNFHSYKRSSAYEYIGRGSYWGNPHSMFEKGESRDEVIRKYKYDFDYDKFPNKSKNEVFKLAGKRLGCFCKPELCHGDVLADYLNSWDDGE